MQQTLTIKAYEKHGFKKLEPLPYPHNKDSFTMQKMIEGNINDSKAILPENWI